jgi:hypothetical protein
MDPVSFDAHVLQKISHECKFSSCIIITVQVMAFTRMSPGYPHGIGALSKGGKNKFRAHSTGARDPYHPDIRRVFHPADPCKICGPVTAPVAQKTDDFNIIIIHSDGSPLNNFTQGKYL